MSDAPQIAARDIVKSFTVGNRRIDVLRGVDLDVRTGETVFLVGASGAGKTTLLYTLAGLEKPNAGEVRFGGGSIYAMGDAERARLRNRSMGFVFQGYFLLPELTAIENTLLPGRIVGRRARAAAAELLEAVGLGDRMEHLPSQLSGGEQQRVAIARALLNDPAVLFADEPTGNLDSANGAAIMDLLVELARNRGKTLVIVTHDPTHAGRGDRRVEIRDGRIAGAMAGSDG